MRTPRRSRPRNDCANAHGTVQERHMRQTIELTLIFVLMSGVGFADTKSHCAAGLASRSADQVLNDHFAAIRSGDLDLILCDYSSNATVMTPGTVITGPDGIRGFYSQIFAL